MIAFVRHGHVNAAGQAEPTIMTVNPQGDKGLRALHPGFDPAWSPDGNKLAFAENDVGIEVMDASGGNVQRLTPSSPGATAPAWSPDGSQIAFVDGSATNGGLGPVVVMNADGSGAHNVMPSGMLNASHLAWAGVGIAAVAFVAPDVDSRPAGCKDTFGWGIYLIGSDGTGCKPLYDEYTDWNAQIPELDFSPSGAKLAFTRETVDFSCSTWGGGACATYDIFTVPSDGSAAGSPTNITGFGAQKFWGFRGIAWSPDGSQFAGGAEMDTSGPTYLRVYRVPAGGGAFTEVTDPFAEEHSGPDDREVAWQPCLPGTQTCTSVGNVVSPPTTSAAGGTTTPSGTTTTDAVTTTTATTPSGGPAPPGALQTRRAIGANCGVNKFDWYDVDLQPMAEKKQGHSCVFLLGNAVAAEALDVAAQAGVTLTAAFGDALRQILVEKAPGVAASVVANRAQAKLKAAGWKLLAESLGVPEAVAAFGAITSTVNVGQVVALQVVPLSALWVVDQIEKKGACVQVDVAARNGKLAIDWNLVYNPLHVRNLKDDLGMTKTWANERIVRTLRFDQLKRHGLAFQCSIEGKVNQIGSGAGVYSRAVVWTS